MKIQITSVSVKNIEYTGARHPCLNIGYRYIAVLVEGYSEQRENRLGSIVWVEFMNTGCNKMIYDSFVAFAEDWNIVGDYKFEECFLPPTPSPDN